MPQIENNDPNTEVWMLDGMLRVEIKTFVLSIQAMSHKGSKSMVWHAAATARQGITDYEAAKKYGIELAKEKWKISDGYTNHNAAAKITLFTFDIDPTQIREKE